MTNASVHPQQSPTQAPALTWQRQVELAEAARLDPSAPTGQGHCHATAKRLRHEAQDARQLDCRPMELVPTRQAVAA